MEGRRDRRRRRGRRQPSAPQQRAGERREAARPRPGVPPADLGTRPARRRRDVELQLAHCLASRPQRSRHGGSRASRSRAGARVVGRSPRRSETGVVPTTSLTSATSHGHCQQHPNLRPLPVRVASRARSTDRRGSRSTGSRPPRAPRDRAAPGPSPHPGSRARSAPNLHGARSGSAAARARAPRRSCGRCVRSTTSVRPRDGAAPRRSGTPSASCGLPSIVVRTSSGGDAWHQRGRSL